MILKRMLLLILTVSTILFASCSDDNDGGQKTGTMAVHLTDAPFPYDLVAEANVTITKIDARNKTVEEDSTAEGDIERDSPFVVLMEEEVSLNLLNLTNGITETLANIDVPVGTYDLVRVYISEASIILNDGTSYELTIPSGSSSGLKVFIDPGITVAGGLTSDLLLDFDVSRSFIPLGGIENVTGFNFNPVIKASNLSTAGTLTGAVTILDGETSVGLEGATITVFNGEEMVTSTLTDVDGTYTVMGLDAGTYAIKAEINGYTARTVEGVGIVAANQTTQNFELVVAE